MYKHYRSKLRLSKFRLGAVSLASTLALLVSSLAPAFIAPVHAGTLSSTYIRESNMTAAGTSTLRLVFTPAGNPGVSGKVILTFPAGYTITSGAQTTSTATCPAQTGATALPITSATGSGQAITIVLSAVLTAATPYCVDLNTNITNPSAGNYVVAIATQTSGSSPVDSTSVGLDSITGADTVTVSATVPPSFTMVLSGTTDALGTINPGTVAISGGQSTTFTTNAAHGWFAWVEDASPAGLTSVTASHTIPTVSVGSTTNLNSAPSTEQYGLDAIITHTGTGDPGTLSIATGYNGGATTSKTAGGVSATQFNTYASNTGTANGDIINFYEMATASGQTPAANDYTDVLTMLGAGSF